MFLPCSHHNLHLYPWPINSNSQTYFHHCLEWAVYKFRNLPPSLLTFPRRPSSLSQAVSLLNLIVCCQWENSCLNISISLGCLSLSNFESKQVNVPTPLARKKPTLTQSIGGCLLLQFTAQSFWPLSPHRAGVMFAYQEIIWLAHHAQAHRVCMAMLLHWFFSVCGSGDHFSHGCSLSALRPTSTCEGVCHNFNCGTKCSQDPCPFSHCCKICGGDHLSYQARPIKSSQTAEVLQPYMYKPHTPTNVPFLPTQPP